MIAERSPIRDAAIRAMLPVAAERGWTWETLRMGLPAAGEDPALAESHFPTGPVGAVLGWIDLVNREMADQAAAEQVQVMRVPVRIRRLVELRLAALAPDRPALRRALGLLALPWNAPLGLRATAETVDAMWHAAGDTSADFSWYTRRASLGAVYSTTMAYWASSDRVTTDDALRFLDRRLEDVSRIGKLRKRLQAGCGKAARPARA